MLWGWLEGLPISDRLAFQSSISMTCNAGCKEDMWKGKITWSSRPSRLYDK